MDNSARRRLRRHPALNVIGLMSGTSGDGVDAALVRISGRAARLRIAPVAFRTVRYPRGLQQRVLKAAVDGLVSEICHLNAVLGECFAKASLMVLRKAGLAPSDVHLIGSHGQTVHHLPTPTREPGVGAIRSTLQIGEPSIIAERTGITTVADFRPRDIAAGGQGAPLTPYAHYMVLRHDTRSRLIVNLGGIGNVTYLPAGKGLESVLAFDTGPGNMVLDGIVTHLSKGQLSMDRHGRWAGTGTPDLDLLQALLGHPFFSKRPPKSTGREEFGTTFIARARQAGRKLRPQDLLATCSLLTAVSISAARRWLPGSVDEVVVGGGGVRNATLMEHLAATFDPIPVRRFEDLGWESKAFEAIAFALLAYQTIQGECSNVPSVTGARHPVLLGKIIPGRWVWTGS